MALHLAGIRRKTEFSPNHVLTDSQIMNDTAGELTKLGAHVVMYDEGELATTLPSEQCIFSMVQGPAGSSQLLGVEAAGALIINSPKGVINCYRVNMVRLLAEGRVPFPHSIVIDTTKPVSAPPPGVDSRKTWVKRGDVHAVHKEDVTMAYHGGEVVSILNEFHERGIAQAVLQEHVEGDTVKFYAIRESEFFYWYYLNGQYRTPFDRGRLQELAARSAELLGLYVYGGDAIIGRDGSITVIDINDWPSFARVREEASRHIAHLIHRKAREHAEDRD